MSERSDDGSSAEAIVLSADGIALPNVGVVPWSDVMGAICLDSGRKQRTYALVRRDAPQPPWFAVTRAMLRRSGLSCDLSELADTINERVGRSGYRHAPQRATRLDADELFDLVINRQAIAESLEILRGPGPRRRSSRLVDALAGAAAGGFIGGMIAAITLNSDEAVLAGSALGAALIAAYTQIPRTPRVKGGPARVLVLTPDGCVVAFPEGPRAFSWGALGRFTIGPSDPSQRPRSRDGLDVVDAEGRALGHIERSWFRGRLEVIVALANAYRARVC